MPSGIGQGQRARGKGKLNVRREDRQSVLSENTKPLHTQLLGLEPARSPAPLSGREWEELGVGVTWHRCLGLSAILLRSSRVSAEAGPLASLDSAISKGGVCGIATGPFFPQIISQRFRLRRIEIPPPQGLSRSHSFDFQTSNPISVGQAPQISSPDRQKLCLSLSAPATPPCKDPPSPGQCNLGAYNGSPKQDSSVCLTQGDGQSTAPGQGKDKNCSEVLVLTRDGKTQM